MICTPFVSTEGQLANVLTKGLSGSTFYSSVSKLGMENIHSPARGGVLESVIRTSDYGV